MNVVMGNSGIKLLLLYYLGRMEEHLTNFSLKNECGCYLNLLILLKTYPVDTCRYMMSF